MQALIFVAPGKMELVEHIVKGEYPVIILLLLIAVVFLLLVKIIKFRQSLHFSSLVKSLFANSKIIVGQKFSFAQIQILPLPVQRYFRLVLNEGQPYISNARILHDGRFKADLKKNWMPISGKQYFTTETPGFIWKGVTSLFTAYDMFFEEKGNLKVFFLSIYKIVDGKGPEFNQGELLRWLAESVWFPTNLLPTEKMIWAGLDDLSATLTFNHNALKLQYKVSFNTLGEITELETQRYMDKKRLETWIARISDYKRINNMLVPTNIEALWKLSNKDFSYAQFAVKKIEYDVPKEWANYDT